MRSSSSSSSHSSSLLLGRRRGFYFDFSSLVGYRLTSKLDERNSTKTWHARVRKGVRFENACPIFGVYPLFIKIGAQKTTIYFHVFDDKFNGEHLRNETWYKESGNGVRTKGLHIVSKFHEFWFTEGLTQDRHLPTLRKFCIYAKQFEHEIQQTELDQTLQNGSGEIVLINCCKMFWVFFSKKLGSRNSYGSYFSSQLRDLMGNWCVIPLLSRTISELQLAL